jgi:hypothetical protein
MTVQNPAERLLRWLMVIIIGSMTLLVFLNVVLRYGFNSNLTVTEELGRYLFVWLTFLGGISAFIRNRHVRVGHVLSAYAPGPATRGQCAQQSGHAGLLCADFHWRLAADQSEHEQLPAHQRSAGRHAVFRQYALQHHRRCDVAGASVAFTGTA